MQKKSKISEIKSYFGFYKHWNELPEYAGYTAADGTNWQSIKDEFYILHKYNYENPKFLVLQKDKKQISVCVYGFRIPDIPLVINLGTDATIRGRIVFCKILATKELVAITW